MAATKRAEMQRTVAVLTRASEILSDPDHWTQGAWAAKDNPKTTFPSEPMVSCSVDDKNASCFCAEGAIQRAAFELYPTRTWQLIASQIIGEVDDYVAIHYDTYNMKDYEAGIVTLNDTGFSGVVLCGGSNQEQLKAVRKLFANARAQIKRKLAK